MGVREEYSGGCVGLGVVEARRLLVLSDTHGRLREGLIEQVRPTDAVLHCGDIGSAAVLDELAATGARVIAILGNNDDVTRMGVPPLETCVHFALQGFRVAAIHGHQCASAAKRHGYLRQRFPDLDLVCYGHSHRRVLDQEARPWILNPGACGRARAYGGAGFALVQSSAGDLEVSLHGL